MGPSEAWRIRSRDPLGIRSCCHGTPLYLKVVYEVSVCLTGSSDMGVRTDFTTSRPGAVDVFFGHHPYRYQNVVMPLKVSEAAYKVQARASRPSPSSRRSRCDHT
jgi:hypothetical protein